MGGRRTRELGWGLGVRLAPWSGEATTDGRGGEGPAWLLWNGNTAGAPFFSHREGKGKNETNQMQK